MLQATKINSHLLLIYLVRIFCRVCLAELYNANKVSRLKITNISKLVVKLSRTP